MKDLLSAVILRKHFCKENCTTNEEVLGVFKGLLSVLCKAKKARSSDVLASVLSKAIVAEANAIAECNSLEETDIGEVETGTGKSGKLHKLHDNCLGHCLGFLSVSDRMRSIEVTCHRLFHVSRSVSYGIAQFQAAVTQLQVADSRLVSLARRMQCSQFNSTVHRNSAAAALCDCVKLLRPRLDTLRIDSRLLSVLQLTFPRLTRFHVSTVPVSELGSLYAFLRRHTSLQTISADMPLSEEFLTTACECPNVSSLFVRNVNTDLTAAATRLNLKKITAFGVDICEDFHLIKPLLHSGTRQLCIGRDDRGANYACNDHTMYDEELALPSLTQLTISVNSTASLRNLKLRTSPKMEQIKCTVSLLELDECLRLCPFGNVSVKAEIGEIGTLEVSLLRSRLLDVFMDKHKFAHTRLRLEIVEPDEDEHPDEYGEYLEAVRDFVPFFIAAERFIDPKLVTLAVSPSVDAYLRDISLGPEGILKLKNVVNFIVSESC